MAEILVTFDFNGKEYKGHFTKVMGAGSSGIFHLNVGERHCGELFHSQGRP
jgi:hypothetical protein